MRLSITTLLIAFVFIANSQSSYVSGLFPTIDHSGNLSQKFDYSLYYFAAFPLIDLQNPSDLKSGFFNLFYLEQALNYKLTNKISLSGAYVYQRENVLYPNYVNEHRFHLQAKHKFKFRNSNIVNRLRFDGRFLSSRFSETATFAHRLRYLVGFDTPLSTKNYLVAYQEVFFNTFKNASSIYAENWAYAALGKNLNSKNKIEAGILYITWNTGPKAWFHQYYLQVTWLNNISFKKDN